MTGQGSSAAIAHYAAHADALRDRYDTLPTEDIYAPVRHLVPATPCRTADIGTATGRDARWFADMGHTVTAVDPVAAFLEPARKSDARINWLIDALPDLPGLSALGQVYDLVNLSAVWHHLAPEERGRATATLARLTAPGGLLLMALRHGPTPPGLPLHTIDVDATAGGFGQVGLAEVFRCPAPSIQKVNRDAGVTWTWLAFQAAKGVS
ncbi:class I SAM-dependent methyltransferase [Tabrizicola sp.]|uniref:class I SAM-dependent methyltransferase n=1 Tax=Tabrizicola sp. TaxID=2005166 RepID=UPI003F312D4E